MTENFPNNMAYRIERDSLGEKQVPADALSTTCTQRRTGQPSFSLVRMQTGRVRKANHRDKILILNISRRLIKIASSTVRPEIACAAVGPIFT